MEVKAISPGLRSWVHIKSSDGLGHQEIFGFNSELKENQGNFNTLNGQQLSQGARTIAITSKILK